MFPRYLMYSFAGENRIFYRIRELTSLAESDRKIALDRYRIRMDSIVRVSLPTSDGVTGSGCRAFSGHGRPLASTYEVACELIYRGKSRLK
jgi:hypothetical protein